MASCLRFHTMSPESTELINVQLNSQHALWEYVETGLHCSKVNSGVLGPSFTVCSLSGSSIPNLINDETEDKMSSESQWDVNQHLSRLLMLVHWQEKFRNQTETKCLRTEKTGCVCYYSKHLLQVFGLTFALSIYILILEHKKKSWFQV